MEVTALPKRIRIKRCLPYLAVFQADLHQTLHSWLYRFWVILSVLVSGGYILYRFGAYKEVGLVRPAAELITDLMHWLVLGSLTMIIILTVGCISSERGTMADSVLSRGISRFQYYLGKWHARMVSVIGTFFLLSSILLAACYFLLRDEHLSITGSAVALVNVASLLIVVISCAVAVSAMCNSTLLGAAIVWMLLYGVGFLFSHLPPVFPSPDRALKALPNILSGYYDLNRTYTLLGWALGASFLLTMIGITYFSRRDI